VSTLKSKEPLAWYRDEFRASERASETRRDDAFRTRRRRLRGRGTAAVFVASLTVMVGVAAAATPANPTQQGGAATTTQAVQQALGVTADGVYGSQTRQAVMAFQRAHGLLVDGIAGPQTLAALGVAGGAEEVAALKARAASAPTASTDGDSSLLARIAQCESGGDPTAVSGTGMYRGKYQFSRTTWAGVGGSGDPAAASEAEQDKRAAMLLKIQGPAAWPVCSQA
jgi:peptidoglycan hydrolase-like protein with peptidoglycan-binding domain